MSTSMKDLLEAGVHFGHQTQRWNPKMDKYIYGAKSGIHILDLRITYEAIEQAQDYVQKLVANSGKVLFVGTKPQAQQVIEDQAIRAGMPYVNFRWLGGMLTNFKTIALSIDKLRKVEKMKETGDFELLTKKERSKIDKDVVKLERNLGGIKDMRKLPGAIFVVDPNNERIAIREANTLGIPVIAVTDTNCDPEGVDYVVPGNDDAIKSIVLFTSYFSNSVVEGGSVAASKSKKSGQTKVERDAALEKEIISKYENDIDLKEEE